MLTSISIENFRCFEKAEFSGFSLINVLGGENNAGKTALLEAIYLACANPYSKPIQDIYVFRKFDMKIFNTTLKGKIFENLFWNQDINSEISIVGKTDSSNTYTNEIKCNSGFELIISQDGVKYKIKQDGEDAPYIGFDSYNRKVIPISFLPTKYEMSKIDLVRSYEELDSKRKGDILLKAFQIIDPDIESIKTYSYNPLSLHIARKGENYMPISFFGDAMNKIAYCILHIIKAAKGILLIDEIENGIHHEHQRDFWRALLLLAKEYEVQIFATSHSLEMIRAYNDVAMELETTKTEFADVCHYFEMARHAKTQQITAIKMNMNMLHRKIVKNNPFRGE